jgi:hypothetical protein
VCQYCGRWKGRAYEVRLYVDPIRRSSWEGGVEAWDLVIVDWESAELGQIEEVRWHTFMARICRLRYQRH